MTIAVETALVVAMAFAVFAAITALGSSLVLGIGFERLRAGFELIKSQTGFFSDAITKLDRRVDGVEKQGAYFFEAIHNLEQRPQASAPVQQSLEDDEPLPADEPCLISTRKPDSQAAAQKQLLWSYAPGRSEVRFH